MSEFSEDGLDRAKREGDQVVAIFTNGWRLHRDTADERQLMEWIDSVNEELAHPHLRPTRKALEALRKEVAVRLVELRQAARVA